MLIVTINRVLRKKPAPLLGGQSLHVKRTGCGHCPPHPLPPPPRANEETQWHPQLRRLPHFPRLARTPGSPVVLTKTGPLWQSAMTLSVHPGRASRACGSCLGLLVTVLLQGLCGQGARVEFLDSVEILPSLTHISYRSRMRLTSETSASQIHFLLLENPEEREIKNRKTDRFFHILG